MRETFSHGDNLTTVPAIPSRVNWLYYTFCYCPKLTGNSVVNSTSLSTYGHNGCFKDSATDASCNLIISGSAPIEVKNALLSTKSSNSHISVAQ